MIPANIRFKFYPTPEDVKLENKFAAIPMLVPLTEDMESAYGQIKKVTDTIKSLPFFYINYALALISNILLPKFIPKMAVDDVSKKFTLAYSNTPGPIKPFYYVSPKGDKIYTHSSCTYIITPGVLGLAVSSISFCNSFKVAVTSDALVFDENEKLAKLIYDNINNQIIKHKITLQTYEKLNGSEAT